MSLMDSSTNLIGNPIYNLTFQDLFGPNGTVVKNQSGKERLLSFIQDLFPSDDIKFIQYLEIVSNSEIIKNTFDIVCSCYDYKGDFIYYVAIHMQKYPFFVESTVQRAAQLLSNEIAINHNHGDLSKIRGVSILTENYGDSLPGIFNDQITIPESGNVLSQHISWMYIQLPKIQKEGINLQWLQILSAGIEKTDLIPFDTPIKGDVYESGLTVLKTYIQPKKLKQLSAEVMSFADSTRFIYRIVNDAMIEGRLVSKNRGIIDIVCNFVKKKKFTRQQIAEILEIDIDLINFIISIAQVYHDYLVYCEQNNEDDPNYVLLLEKISKQFKLDT